MFKLESAIVEQNGSVEFSISGDHPQSGLEPLELWVFALEGDDEEELLAKIPADNGDPNGHKVRFSGLQIEPGVYTGELVRSGRAIFCCNLIIAEEGTPSHLSSLRAILEKRKLARDATGDHKRTLLASIQ